MIVIDTAFQIAEAYGQQHAGTGRNASSTTLPDRQAIGYDVFLDGDSIDRFEFQDEVEPGFPKLRKQHKRYERSSNWDERDTKLYGEPPFPDQRFFIEYGDGPYIKLTVHFNQYITRHGGYCYERRSRTFVPRSYPNDELAHYRISREQLKEWVLEFLPSDPNRIRSEDDVNFVTGGNGGERLKHRVVRYLERLPDIESNWERHEVSQRAIFETSYVSGLLDISGWYAEKLCSELVEEAGPVVKVVPPEDKTSFEISEFAVAHQNHWENEGEFDYNTRKYRGASRVTSSRITVT
ncbi:hypothetical protein [Halosimplex pelagicum]|uniref:Uncharacterized protein n=1 Tax=Halosimplex pelagicum TaxID=869886 RepID=A0A7D5P6V8_9EURY|nr:hypothetical protein [Halosimplex pelagicum]QLH82246.1 hypothetical protein HZS54_11775 [Halosimplex pelagicum]